MQVARLVILLAACRAIDRVFCVDVCCECVIFGCVFCRQRPIFGVAFSRGTRAPNGPIGVEIRVLCSLRSCASWLLREVCVSGADYERAMFFTVDHRTVSGPTTHPWQVLYCSQFSLTLAWYPPAAARLRRWSEARTLVPEFINRDTGPRPSISMQIAKIPMTPSCSLRSLELEVGVM